MLLHTSFPFVCIIMSGDLTMAKSDTPPEISVGRIRSFLAVAEHGSIRGALAGLDLAFTETRSAGSAAGGDLAIAYYPSLASGNLRQLLAARAQKWPRIRAEYTEAPSEDQLAGCAAVSSMRSS
ncbi:MAG: hypothetical protein JJ942_01490 [Roseitalea sp.]|nr:hypothetical protein [Roseitalea sp.]